MIAWPSGIFIFPSVSMPWLNPLLLLLQVPGSAPYLSGIFAFNYSALASLGLSASALSGMKYALPKLIRGKRGILIYLPGSVLALFLSSRAPACYTVF
jgi:hypothetical protein